MTNPDPNGNIYLTYKARMIAEVRLKGMDFISQLVVGWYSFCIIAISLLDISQTYKIRDVSVMTAILSIAVLGISIFLAGQKYEVRAVAFRDCYLKLQKLYRSDVSDAEKARSYDDILGSYENHKACDHENVLFQAWAAGKVLRDPEGEVIITKAIIVNNIRRRVARAVVLIVVFLAPVCFGYILLIPRGV